MGMKSIAWILSVTKINHIIAFRLQYHSQFSYQDLYTTVILYLLLISPCLCHYHQEERCLWIFQAYMMNLRSIHYVGGLQVKIQVSKYPVLPTQQFCKENEATFGNLTSYNRHFYFIVPYSFAYFAEMVWLWPRLCNSIIHLSPQNPNVIAEHSRRKKCLAPRINHAHSVGWSIFAKVMKKISMA